MSATRTHRHRGSSIVTILIVLVVLALGGVGFLAMQPCESLVESASASTSAPVSAGWQHTLDEGLAAADATGRPMFVLYTADWCPPCQQFKRQVLSDDDVIDYLEARFVLVKIDLTVRSGPNSEVAAMNGVEGVPTMMVYDSDGALIDKMEGASGAKNDFLAWAESCRK